MICTYVQSMVFAIFNLIMYNPYVQIMYNVKKIKKVHYLPCINFISPTFSGITN